MMEKISVVIRNIRELRIAMKRQEFKLYYQPKVDLTSGEITGVEALIRWEHPEKGLIYPSGFIPYAEASEFIVDLGEWVLRTACMQNKSWQEAGIPSMIMAVNVSGRQLYQPHFIEQVQLIIEETGLAPEYLELEITENTIMDVNRVIPILQSLKRIGVRISLDDFGMGYSCLFWLQQFPIDIIKIDRSFINNCTVDLKDATIVKSIIEMAHELGVDVVAEGIESKEQLIFLQQQLCDRGQGYLFCKPLPPTDVTQKFFEIKHTLVRNGIPLKSFKQMWMKEAREKARQELVNTLRYQQGMIYKFKMQNDRLVHTLCDGELLYKLNLTPEQIIGHEPHDFLPKSVADEHLLRAWNGENVNFEGELNGISYLTSLRPIRKGGQIVEVIASSVDITTRKETERLLYNSERKYRFIADNMHDLVGVLDGTGIMKYVSPSVQTVLGFSSTELEGNSIFDWIHPDEVPHARRQLYQVLISKKPCCVEYRCQHAEGSWITLEAYCSPVIDELGEVSHGIIVARDVTERKKIEERIRKSEKLSVVGQLAAGVAHEIRNPLTAIKGFVQLLEYGTGNSSLYIEMISSEIRRLEAITETFLTLTKPHLSQKDQINIKVLLKGTIMLFRTQTILQNVRIIEEYDSNLPSIFCDENHIKQVFINIFQNALDAMPNGGALKIQVLSDDSRNIKFRVIDQGCGMTEERLKHIGEPFYSSTEKGTGLGLMISHKIIHEHGGSIHIDSILNKGTTVDIILPIRDSGNMEHDQEANCY